MMSYGVSSCCEFLKRDAEDMQTNGSEGWILLNEYDLSLTGNLSGRYTSWEHKVPMICATLICWTSRSRAKSPNEDMIENNYSKKNKDYKQNEMNWISKNSKRIEKRRTYKKATRITGISKTRRVRTRPTGRTVWTRRNRRTRRARRARRKDTAQEPEGGVSVCTRQRMSSQIKDRQLYPNPQSSYLFVKLPTRYQGPSLKKPRIFKRSGNIPRRVNWDVLRKY